MESEPRKWADAHPRLSNLYEFIKSVVIEFYKDNGFIASSSLVYSTLMSLVPFLAVLTALFAAFGGIDILKANYAGSGFSIRRCSRKSSD